MRDERSDVEQVECKEHERRFIDQQHGNDRKQGPTYEYDGLPIPCPCFVHGVERTPTVSKGRQKYRRSMRRTRMRMLMMLLMGS